MVLYREKIIDKNPEIQKKLTDYSIKNPVVVDHGIPKRIYKHKKTSSKKKSRKNKKV